MIGGDSILAVARLLQPHGLRGEIYAVSLAPEVLDFGDLLFSHPLILRPIPGRGLHPSLPSSLKVESAAPYKQGWLIAFHEIVDRTAAEHLKSVELCLKRSDLPSLPEGCYWEAELEGLAVRDETRGHIGHVASLEQLGAQWSLRVTLTKSPTTINIPWVNALVPIVDLDQRRIETRLPLDYPGLDSE